MLTLKEWDAISTELEPQVMPDYGEKQQQYLWSLYGGLLQLMKDNDMTIDDTLFICEYHLTEETKGLSKKS